MNPRHDAAPHNRPVLERRLHRAIGVATVAEADQQRHLSQLRTATAIGRNRMHGAPRQLMLALAAVCVFAIVGSVLVLVFRPDDGPSTRLGVAASPTEQATASPSLSRSTPTQQSPTATVDDSSSSPSTAPASGATLTLSPATGNCSTQVIAIGAGFEPSTWVLFDVREVGSGNSGDIDKSQVQPDGSFAVEVPVWMVAGCGYVDPPGNLERYEVRVFEMDMSPGAKPESRSNGGAFASAVFTFNGEDQTLVDQTLRAENGTFVVTVDPDDGRFTMLAHLDSAAIFAEYKRANDARNAALLADPPADAGQLDVLVTFAAPIAWDDFVVLRDDIGMTAFGYYFATFGPDGEKVGGGHVAASDAEVEATIVTWEEADGADVRGVMAVEGSIPVTAAGLGKLTVDPRVYIADTTWIEAVRLAEAAGHTVPAVEHGLDVFVPTPYWELDWAARADVIEGSDESASCVNPEQEITETIMMHGSSMNLQGVYGTTWASSIIVRGVIVEVDTPQYIRMEDPLREPEVRRDDPTNIFTDYVVRIDALYRGSTGSDTVTIRRQGGICNGVQVINNADPELSLGAEGVFFVRPTPTSEDSDSLGLTSVFWIVDEHVIPAGSDGQADPRVVSDLAAEIAAALQQQPPEQLQELNIPLDVAPPGPDLPK